MQGNNLQDLEKKLGVVFKQKDFLRQALVHRSYLNENRNYPLGNNERLEFLGDAVLEMAVTEHLYKNYPNSEGELTNWRAALVCGKTLSSVGSRLGVNHYILLSRGEEKDNGKAKRLILANAMEAIIGAIYLDQGMKAAKKFIKKNITPLLPKIIKNGSYLDPKSHFQEISQKKKITPIYKVLKEEGPDHQRHFQIGVYLGNTLAGKGEGSSKREAEENAARDALSRMKKQ